MGELRPGGEGYVYAFRAMATPCEILIDAADAAEAERVGRIAEDEAARIEAKYSRYRPESLLSRVNAAGGAAVEVDEETAALLDYADQCFRLSGGKFDVTSGVLRRVWRFDGSASVPTRRQVAEVLPSIGWAKVSWRKPAICLPVGMEIDFGGLGKEYAVDRAAMLIAAASAASALVNYGGDLRVTAARASGRPWRVAIEAIDESRETEGLLELASGALATSGDTRRFLEKSGRRYSHILNPLTGWPVKDPPRSVTVAAPTCMQAGLMSTIAMLQGRAAERFLKREGVQAWCVRG